MAYKYRSYAADSGTGQVHKYHGAADHYINLKFNPGINIFSHGHHMRGDTDGAASRGNDVFNFEDTSNVTDVIVGRIEDFDFSRDEIHVEGVLLDFDNLPANVRLVEYNGHHNDPGADPQHWILIETSTGGHIFYAFEGARVDMTGDGGSNSGNQEYHFLQSAPNLASLPDVVFIDQQNYVPDGYSPNNGGVKINDDDDDAADVSAVIFGTSGGDLIAAGINDDRVEAGEGDDTVWGGSGADKLYGGSGNDEIYGGTSADKVVGEAGADILFGGHGDDKLYGAGGFDDLWGEDGDDELYGGGGNDILRGGAGQDVLLGGGGNDTLNGGSNHDAMEGGSGDDVLNGGSGDDTLEGEDGDDELNGGTGEDLLSGGTGADILHGNEEADKIYGGAGSDTLYGGGGSDQLIAGGGSDILFGGSGADSFVFKAGSAVDIIKDFANDTDILLFSEDLVGSSDPKTAAHYLTYASVIDGDIVFDFGNGDLLIIEGYTNISSLEDDIALF